jgi:hypothetical protein
VKAGNAIDTGKIFPKYPEYIAAEKARRTKGEIAPFPPKAVPEIDF